MSDAPHLGALSPTGKQPRRQHRLRRHPAAGPHLRYLSGFRSQVARVVLKAVDLPGRPEFRVDAVGMLEGASLITACPMVRGVPTLRSGDALEVRLFALRDLVIFQSEMLTLSTFPAPYLHLAWPQELCVIRIRSSARTQIDKPATFSLRIDQEMIPVPGNLVDLSATGAAFLCDALGAVQGDEGELLLTLTIDGNQPPVYVHPRCVVRTVREPLREGGCLQYGLEFVDMSMHDTMAIRAFLGELEQGDPLTP